MNNFIKTQIETMKAYSESFLQGCKMSALLNDGKTDAKEQEELIQIERATKDYIIKLNKIMKK